MTALEEQYKQAEVLRVVSEKLIAERKALTRVMNNLLELMNDEVQNTRVFYQNFMQFKKDYVDLTKKLTLQVSSLKSLSEMTRLNRELAAALES